MGSLAVMHRGRKYINTSNLQYHGSLSNRNIVCIIKSLRLPMFQSEPILKECKTNRQIINFV